MYPLDAPSNILKISPAARALARWLNCQNLISKTLGLKIHGSAKVRRGRFHSAVALCGGLAQ